VTPNESKQEFDSLCDLIEKCLYIDPLK